RQHSAPHILERMTRTRRVPENGRWLSSTGSRRRFWTGLRPISRAARSRSCGPGQSRKPPCARLKTARKRGRKAPRERPGGGGFFVAVRLRVAPHWRALFEKGVDAFRRV